MSSCLVFSQADTSRLKDLYDRCLDFSEEKIDSLKYYATYIEQESARLKFNKGPVLSLRLKGLYEDLNNNYEKAIEYYLQSLEEARRLHAVEYEMSALSDLAIAYSAIKEPAKAKEFYVLCAQLVRQRGEVSSLVNTYNNLAVIYTQLQQYDSARIFLNDALRIGKPHEANIDLTSVYNNLGNVCFREKKYDEALVYFRRNYLRHTAENNTAGLWVATLNLADVYIEKKMYDSAQHYTDNAMKLATQLGSKSKEADSYSILAKLHESRGDFNKAYKYLKEWYSLDTAIVHFETYRTIAELQERFYARERAAENNLLLARVEKERIRTRGFILLAIALGVIGILVAAGLINKRRVNQRLQATNELIIQQNEKLSELNHEKNALISIVSHDLNTPFATIQIWSRILGNETDNLSEEQLKALTKIMQASNYGEEMIARILDIEKTDIGMHRMQLENFDLTIFAEQVIDGFKQVAAEKGIQLHTELPGKKLYILSDRQLVSRICANLLSNAIKYTPRGKNVWISVNDLQDAISIRIRDEGVGIERDELPYLFSKYSKISSQPTDGEPSTGLGLSIVKRIVEEINGKIFCESEPGVGSLFTVILKK
jgi:signal transduction histidine kinase/Tfp pilus assembly protein PilF